MNFGNQEINQLLLTVFTRNLRYIHVYYACTCNCMFIIIHFQTDDRSIQELCKLPPIRNSPRIIEISDMKETSYHNVCEQTVFCKTFSYSESLFLFCSVLYEYPKKVNNVLCFLQDHVLNFPDCSSRPTNFVTVVTDIKKNIIQYIIVLCGSVYFHLILINIILIVQLYLITCIILFFLFYSLKLKKEFTEFEGLVIGMHVI